MANPQHAGPFRKQARIVDKAATRKAEQANWRKVCRAVDERDKRRCRSCSVATVATLSAIPSRREHHHVIPRSLGGKDVADNVCVLCLICHTKVHVDRSLEISGNANLRLYMRVWTCDWSTYYIR